MAEAQTFDAVVAAIRQDLLTATEALLSASEAGLRDIDLVRAGGGEAIPRVEEAFLKVLQACAVEDVIGQRLTQLESIWARTADPSSRSAPVGGGLENGPAHPGQGLDQSQIDAWLNQVE
ncbi:hypothetical protein ACIQTU_06435 [Brevundimonas sp. NPDC090276]|uniref:hypothetical protein n=1 Tax=Brevundimonas sp. NPDC090276 TaxID=3363956 RepID=UPI00383BA7B9